MLIAGYLRWFSCHCRSPDSDAGLCRLVLWFRVGRLSAQSKKSGLRWHDLD
jgi:hypothetical protein